MNQYIFQDNEEEDDMALNLEELEKLAKSEKIKEFLRDDKLREIIHHINFTARSGNVEDLLDKKF
ncbi:43121_t:CDS:2 [Gigaspora margarita]|uniref:43121_t:CDS:1 n=1 Tax=Gigaspora margarita TaxID=4874 RepID=A0ABN7VHJ3_GIGMA|nr:43121_t:CDS:2 [Gigaspora margarita]